MTFAPEMMNSHMIIDFQAPVSGRPSVKADEDSIDKTDSGIYDEHNTDKSSDRTNGQMECGQYCMASVTTKKH